MMKTNRLFRAFCSVAPSRRLLSIRLSTPFLLGLMVTTMVSGGPIWNGSSVQAQELQAQELKTGNLFSQAVPNSSVEFQAELPASVATAVLRDAQYRFNLAPGTVQIVQATAKTFANPCEFNGGQVCTREYRPIAGWQLVVQGPSQSWIYHAQGSGGTQVVLISQGNLPTGGMPLTLQNQVLNEASRLTGQPVSSLRIRQATSQTFANACVFNFGDRCTTEYRPVAGWEVVVATQTQPLTYRINQTGTQIALAPSTGGPTAQLPVSIQRAVLRDAQTWTQSQTVKIVEAQPQTWSNTCVFNLGSVCPMIYQPVQGWNVKVNSGNLSWTYRTNPMGTTLISDRRAMLPPNVADAIVQTAVRRTGPAIQESALRFLDVKQQPKRVCFALSGCRMEPSWLVVLANGRQQWGYQSDAQGRQVLPVSVAQVGQPGQ